MRGGRVGSLAASPTLVGAVTVLVVVVAVFLSYQANQGLPFVPTYKLSAELPNADTLVPGNDVRIGGIRVGQIKTVDPETVNNAPCPNDPTRQCTTQVAKVNMELNQDIQPLPENSTVVVRSKSALGLKYLEIDRGNSSQGFSPAPRCRSPPRGPSRWRSTRSSTCSTTRPGSRSSRTCSSSATRWPGAGVDLNEAIGQLKPLVQVLTPVMRNLADPNTGLSNFVSSLSATAAEVAPVAEIQGQLFADLDTTFAAFARVSRPFIQESISPLARCRGHRDRDAADDPAVPRQHGQALRRARPGVPRHRAQAEGPREPIVERGQGARSGARVQRPARPDGAGAAQPRPTTPARVRASRPDPVQQHARPAAQLHHARAVGLQLRLDPVQQRRQPRQLQRRGRERPALHRAAAPAGARAARSARAPRRPTAGRPRRRTSSTTTRIRTRRPRVRPASARRVTRASRAGYDRERPRQPGHPHLRPDPPAGPEKKSKKKKGKK